jgi:hypothetical protein
MGDRELVRRALWLLAAAGLMFCACLKPESTLCGEQEACPSGYACSEGACERAVTRCPAEAPTDEIVISAVDLTCTYGEEECCGKRVPGMTCKAPAGGEFTCLPAESCLIHLCE